MKLAVLFTGGKDSVYATYLAKKQGHQIICLIALKSENQYSYMFHTPAIELTELQAEAMGLPLITHPTAGEKEAELKDLAKAIKKARSKFDFEGIITGALFSDYQSSRIQKIAENLKLKVVSPLWHKPQEKLMQELIDSDFEIVLTGIAGEGLNQDWLGRKLDNQMLKELKEINQKIGTNVAFEGGEAESLVLDCPLFNKKIRLIKTKKIMDSYCSGRLVIKKAKLEEK